MDIAVIGCFTPRRGKIYDQLKPWNLSNIQGFGTDRDLKLFKHKILLNIHRNEDTLVFEEIRCTRCIFNKMIVITEDSINIDNYMYRKHIIVVPYNDIVSKTIDVIQKYDYYYNLLFHDFHPTTKFYEPDVNRGHFLENALAGP